MIGGSLDELMHLYMLNEGILFTPFHMMAPMSPATTEGQVDRHTEAFERIAAELVCRPTGTLMKGAEAPKHLFRSMGEGHRRE